MAKMRFNSNAMNAKHSQIAPAIKAGKNRIFDQNAIAVIPSVNTNPISNIMKSAI